MFTFEFILNTIALFICIYQIARNFTWFGTKTRKEIDEYHEECYQHIKELSDGLNNSLLSFSVYTGNILIMIKTVISVVLTAYAVNYFGIWIAACIILLITAVSLSVSADDLMSYVQNGTERTKKPMIFSTIELGFDTVYFLVGLIILSSRVIGMIA